MTYNRFHYGYALNVFIMDYSGWATVMKVVAKQLFKRSQEEITKLRATICLCPL